MQEIRNSNPPVVLKFVIQINLEHNTIAVCSKCVMLEIGDIRVNANELKQKQIF